MPLIFVLMVLVVEVIEIEGSLPVAQVGWPLAVPKVHRILIVTELCSRPIRLPDAVAR